MIPPGAACAACGATSAPLGRDSSGTIVCTDPEACISRMAGRRCSACDATGDLVAGTMPGTMVCADAKACENRWMQ